MIPRISIIIPTKYEAAGLFRVIRSVKKYAHEIIVVDGHSNDGTKEIAKKEKVKFFLDHYKGKGDALRLGITKATGNVIIFFDADGSPEPKDIPKLVGTLITEKADMVITSRRTGGSYDFQITLDGIMRTMGSDFMAYLVNKRFNTNFSDVLYNFRAIKRDVAKKLHCTADGFAIEQEMLVKTLQKGYKVVEIPSRERARMWGKSKLHTFAGIHLLYLLIKQLYF